MQTLPAFAATLAVLLAAPAARAEPAAQPTKKVAMVDKPGATTRYRPDRFAGKAGRYYRLVWGVDALKVKLAESGQLVRFSWRVLDPARAQLLNDQRLEPALVDPKAGVSLVVPAMEKIGKLRQHASPETGKAYWMVFSNKGRKVKAGDRVNVVIGEFRAEGLVVE